MVGMFVVWMLSFSATGMPCRGPLLCPPPARDRAGLVQRLGAYRERRVGRGLACSARRYCRTSSRDVTRPSFMAACMSAMLASATRTQPRRRCHFDWVCTTATQEITTRETTTNGSATGRRVTDIGPMIKAHPAVCPYIAKTGQGVHRVQRSGPRGPRAARPPCGPCDPVDLEDLSDLLDLADLSDLLTCRGFWATTESG